MGEESNQIEREILRERIELGDNLSELQTRVQQMTDWRVQFQKKPILLLGIALGVGFLSASLLLGSAKSKQS